MKALPTCSTCPETSQSPFCIPQQSLQMAVFLLQILLKEDVESKSDGTTGPCLEYLLKHNLLDLLATLATSDDPPGMRQYVLRFITQTLNHLKAPILAHNSVFPSLQVVPSEITHF